MKSESEKPIEKLILEDHKPLKKLLKIMKDIDKSDSEREEAFREFAPLLLTHAKAEEKALYTLLKNESDLRREGLESQVEHDLAEHMVKRSQQSNDADVLNADIKVLAELVEHHIKEEEDEILPDFKKEIDTDVRVELGQKYLRLKDEEEQKNARKTWAPRAVARQGEERPY